MADRSPKLDGDQVLLWEAYQRQSPQAAHRLSQDSGSATVVRLANIEARVIINSPGSLPESRGRLAAVG